MSGHNNFDYITVIYLTPPSSELNFETSMNKDDDDPHMLSVKLKMQYGLATAANERMVLRYSYHGALGLALGACVF